MKQENNDQKEFIQYLIQKSGAKTEQELDQYVQKIGKEGVKKAYFEFQEYKKAQSKNKAQKAKRGAKLNYLKFLKHQCPEEEELYYYKKGGSVGCGCKKKEDGGPLTDRYNKMKSKIQEFKDKYKKKPKVIYPDPEAKKAYENNHQEEPQWYIQPSAKDSPKSPKNSKVTKKAKGGHTVDVLARLKCGSKVKKESCGSKVVKAFKEKCGAKMKKK